MKLFVIAGHGAGDPGASGNGYQEYERVRALATKIKEYGGNNVLLGDFNRNYYKDKGINNLTISKKEYAIIELHMDSDDNVNARGGHVIIKSGFKADKYDNTLADMISTMFPGRANKIVNRSNLANVNRAAAKGYNYRLIECGFISNAQDIAIFNSKIDELAKNILGCFGINAGSVSKPAQTTNASANTSVNSVNYKVKVNTTSGVNCRAEPSTNGAKITAYANGVELAITKESGNWGYANNVGWVCLDYCKKITAPTSAPKPSTSINPGKTTGTYEVTASSLVVRTGPGTTYRRKSKPELTTDGQKHANSNGGLLKGTRVTVSKWSGNWAYIPSGWVSGDYLKKV